MGKPKKDRKNRHEEDFGSDDDVDLDPLANIGNEEKAAAPTAKQSKKEKKKNKHKDLDDDEDVVTKMDSLSMENDDVNGEISSAKSNKKKSKRDSVKKVDSDEDENSDFDLDSIAYAAPVHSSKPRKTMGGFGMLAALEDENDMSQSDNDDNEIKDDVEDEPESQPKKKDKSKKKSEDVVLTPVEKESAGGKKKKNKKVTKEEEDIDALLAALDEPKEKVSKKSKKKKKQAEAEEEAMAAENTEAAENQSEAVTLVEPKVVTMEDLEDGEEESRKKKKKAKKKEKPEGEEGQEPEEGDENEGEEDEAGGTVKTAAQKKKEKREREKKKREQQKLQQTVKKESTPVSDTAEEGTMGAEPETQEEGEKDIEDEEGEGKGKKKKKKGKDEKEPPKKKVPSKQIAALKEHLKKQQEEEEAHRLAEDEKERKLEEARLQREEQKKLDEEKKLKKKQKEKEKTERLKAEGKFLTAKQKQEKKRALQMLELMKAQGLEIPNKEDVPKKRPVYAKKKKPTQRQDSQEESEKSPSPVEEVKESSPEDPPSEEINNEGEVRSEEAGSDVKDSWDVSDEEEEEVPEKNEKQEEAVKAKKVEVSFQDKRTRKKSEEKTEADGDSDESESGDESGEEGSSEEESSDESSDDEDLDSIERARLKIEKRREAAEKKRSTDVLRAPVVCVLGHVDTGKTKILDKLRRTNVQDGEAGGITQQIGATNVPQEALKEKTIMCKEFQEAELKLPGLLIIDTPGHESFSNLRSRGSSLCDIAILVVDIMHGLEPQTIESINLLKSRKTPFIVALNKIDRLYQWKASPNTDVASAIKKQNQNTKLEFEERTKEVVVQFAEQGLNVALFYENKNPKEYISMVPTSAHSGDGMGNMVALICELSQTLLAKRVSYSEELQATVMEVKAIHGLGTTIDVILVNGKIREGQTIVTAGTDGPIITQIRGLLMPQPMKELRVKNQYMKYKEVLAAQGVKIIAKDLEKALAGLPLYVANNADEVDFYKEEVTMAFKAVLSSIKLSERGVFVQASTLGSLEALLEFLKTSKIPYAGIGIGPVHKKDIMKASIMLEHDIQYAVILAFDVKIERESQELAESLGVRVFAADIIYHLFDKFMAYRDQLKKQRQDEFKHLAVFPTKLRILPQYIFNTRDPIVVGVIVEAGFVKEGTPLCVPGKEFVEIGKVTSVEFNHKNVDMARKGQEVCIKIEPIGGDTPKLYGRHFDYNDILVSKISRESIDTVKEYFREEMTKPDWQLIVELKKLFQII